MKEENEGGKAKRGRVKGRGGKKGGKKDKKRRERKRKRKGGKEEGRVGRKKRKGDSTFYFLLLPIPLFKPPLKFRYLPQIFFSLFLLHLFPPFCLSPPFLFRLLPLSYFFSRFLPLLSLCFGLPLPLSYHFIPALFFYFFASFSCR